MTIQAINVRNQFKGKVHAINRGERPPLTGEDGAEAFDVQQVRHGSHRCNRRSSQGPAANPNATA